MQIDSAIFCRYMLQNINFLPLNLKSKVHIDACLGIIPTATRGISKATSLCSTIIGIFGIKHIIHLTQQCY